MFLTKNSPFFLLIAALMLSGCSHEYKTIAVVICDVSNSITHADQNSQNGALEKVKHNIGQITSKIKSPADIYFIPVSENISQECINGEPLLLRRVSMAKSDAQKEENNNKLNKVYQALDSIAERTKNTCLLTSIRRAYDLINTKAETDPTAILKIIIVSDMIEVCGKSVNGKMIMHPDDPTNITQLAKEISDSKMAFSFENSKISITVIKTDTGHSSIYADGLQTLWNGLFQKMHYKGKITLSVDVPEVL
jgi:hypothetical protein